MSVIGEMQYLTIGDSTYSLAAGGSDVVVTPILSSGTQVATISVDGSSSTLYAPTPNDMVVLSYGTSTWNDFITAYNKNCVVYCRASSNTNPASGSQTRLAFMAYVNNGDSPTEVEFQYYRSVSSHSASQQGDQVFVYKLTSSGTWTVTTREASSKIAVTSPVSSSYSSGTITLSLADAYGDTQNPYGTKTANYVLAGPTSGSASAPSFRALVADDIPTLTASKISDISLSNGTITIGSNSITPLTSFTETDPIFTASAAHGITSSDITNWNNKLDSSIEYDSSNFAAVYMGASQYGGYITLSASINNSNLALNVGNAISVYDVSAEVNFITIEPYSTSPNNGTVAIHHVKTPTQNLDAANKKYVDDSIPTTAAEVGAIATSAKGAASGVAELDANGLVPSSQLPSYVDDVLEYANKSSFPATGETGKIYVDLATNLTYRWSGTAYVEISPSLALGTTSSTAFRGDYGNTAYTHATDSSRLTTATASGLYKVASTAEGHIASLTAVTASDIPDLSSIYLTSETYTGTVTSVRVQATSPVQSSTSTAQSTSLNTTISLADGYGDTKNPYGTKTKNYVLAGPTTGSNAAPSFRALVAGDIPDLSGTYATKATTLSGYGITDAYISNGTITLGSNSITPVTSSALADYIASDEIGKVYVSDTEPSNTSNYDIWIDTSTTLQNANGVMV